MKRKVLGALTLVGALVGGAALLVGVPQAAWAQGKYQRKTKDIKVEQTERTKKVEGKSGPAGPDPTITADKFFGIQAQLQQDYDALVKTYKDELSDLGPNDPLRLDYGFRLAEALAQQYRFYHSMSLEASIKADRAKTPKEKSDQQALAKSNEDKGKGILADAVQQYKKLFENPNLDKFQQGDEVLFYFAYTLQQAGYADQAGEVYKTLLKKFQGSRFVPEAYLYFADRYFDARDLANAEAFYNKVLQFPKASVYPYAVYKRGWTYYNEKRLDEAQRAFRETIKLTDGNKAYEPMNKTAKKDFVRVYAESDAPVNVAYQAFQSVDKTDYAFSMLGFLGDYYMDEGKSDKAVYVFHQMIATRPKDKKVCEWQYNIARAYMSTGTNQDKVRELSNLVKLYSAVAAWNPPMPKENLDECYENAAGVTGELAMLWHAEGLKTLNMQTLGDAESLYHVYLDNFPNAENALTMQVNYAELLWNRAAMERDPKQQSARWEATAAEHSKVVNWKGVPEDQRKDSAYATVLAAINALAVDVGADVTEPAGDAAVAEEAIPDKEKKIMDAFQVYLTYVTDKQDQKRTDILFFTGKLYWRHHHYDEARKYLAEVVTEHPEADVAEFAANIILDSLNKQQRYKELNDWATRMAENQALIKAHPNLQQTIAGIYVKAKRDEAQAADKRGDYRACGMAFDRLQQQNPNDPKINEILYNAALCYRKAKMIGRAIAFRQNLVGRPGADKDVNAQRAQMQLGDDYTAIAWYEKAADMYEAYASRFGGEKDAPVALFYALTFRKGIGQDDKAIKDTELYVKTFATKNTHEAANAIYSIGDIYEKNHETDKMVTHLENYIRQWSDKGGVDREIVAHVRAGEALWKESCPVKGEKGSCIAVTRERALRDASSGKQGKHHKAATQTQCGDVSKNKINVYERKPQLVAEAQRHFNTAIDLWKRTGPAKITGKDDNDKTYRTAETIRWVAAANFYLGEQKYEQFLGLRFPTGLNFDPGKPAKQKESLKKFKEWKDNKDKLAAEVNQRYSGVVQVATSGGLNINAAQWAIASAARMGQVLQNYSDALFTAEIPKDVQAYQDAVDAYCDELTNLADPLEKKSIEAFSFCLDSSNKLNWYNDWTQLCEGELAQIRPQDFPAAGEIRTSPSYVPVSIDTQSIMTDLVEAAPKAPQQKGTN
jgi:tetratricopeptide (TPR) repeat protein